MSKVQLPTRVEQEDLDCLTQFAKEDGRPLSNYVRKILQDHIVLKKQQKRRQK